MKVGKRIKIGAILSYVHIALGALITFLFTPFLIHSLGQSDYGLYNTVGSVVASLHILSLGFGSSYVRYFSKYKEENNKYMIDRLNGMFLIVFTLMGIVAFACGIYLSNNLKLVFDKGLNPQELVTAKKMMILMTINLAISFPSSVISSIITAHEEFVFQKTLLLVKQIASPLIMIPVLLSGAGSIGVIITSFVVNLVADIVNIWFAITKLNTRFAFNHFEKGLLKSIAVYSSFIAINMIVDQINLRIDKILLGRFCGTLSVAVYSAGYSLYFHVQSFSTSVSNVFTPRTHKVWSNTTMTEEEKDKHLSEMFGKVGRIQLLILLLICSGLILFGRQFIYLWVGKAYHNAYYVVLILALSCVVPLSQNMGIEIQRAKNKHQFRAIVYAIMAVINLVLSIFLCQLYAEVGSAIGTAISFVIANTILMDWYYHKKLHIDISIYWKNFVRCILSCLPAFAIGLLFCFYMDTFHISYLIIGIVVYTIAYCLSEYFFATSKQEKTLIKISIRRGLNKMMKGLLSKKADHAS